jgi:ribose 5-phosphate isomerase B
VISFGQRQLTEAQVLSMVDIWLTTAFEGGRHLTRIQKLDY